MTSVRQENGTVYDDTAALNMSERYTFLPTSQIIAGMRQEGWAPVEVQQQAVRVETVSVQDNVMFLG